MCTQGFCQIEIVTTVFSIYTVKLWCKLCTMICERERKWEEISQRGTGEKKQQQEYLGVLMRRDRCEMYSNPQDVRCQPQQLNNRHLTTAEDIIVVLLPASLVSWQSSSFSPSTLVHEQPQNQQQVEIYKIHILSTHVQHLAKQRCCDVFLCLLPINQKLH